MIHPPEASPSIEQFQQPRNRNGLVLALVAIAAIVALMAFAALRFNPSKAPTLTPSAQAGQPTSTRTPSARGSVWVSDARGASGYWEILEEKWSSDKVTLKIHLECDKGSTPLVFFVFSNVNASSQWVADDTGTPRPNLHGYRVGAGESIDGWVQISMPRQQATLIMGSSNRNAISGLIING